VAVGGYVVETGAVDGHAADIKWQGMDIVFYAEENCLFF